jgi:hypothetical protein
VLVTPTFIDLLCSEGSEKLAAKFTDQGITSFPAALSQPPLRHNVVRGRSGKSAGLICAADQSALTDLPQITTLY